MNQAEYKPELQWFVKYDLSKDLKANNKGSWALSYDSFLQSGQYQNGLL